MNAKRLLAAPLFLALFLTACNKMAPECDDIRTTDLVLSSTRRHLSSLLGEGSVEMLDIGLGNVTTLSSDRQTGAWYCSAELIFKKEDWEERIAITYRSELSRDKKNGFTITLDDI